MRLFFSLMAAIMLAALALAGCNSRDGSGSAGSAARSTGPSSSTATAPPSTAPGDGVERITTAELRDALEKGTAIVVDVRSPESYKLGHIRGAINIPEPEITRRKDELPRDKKIVFYCS
ncbi:MAG TPA: rhodanese-like domain-containing protein [Pyrinomonadaceae bacterium]|jgi:3-mercaptopyruvate sulfurtransferase SseA